jgi:hypothetical protein
MCCAFHPCRGQNSVRFHPMRNRHLPHHVPYDFDYDGDSYYPVLTSRVEFS